jgi:hypothetical protein
MFETKDAHKSSSGGSMKISDEDAARIQEFTAWAIKKGYHVIGALISPTQHPPVRIFSTAPDGSFEQQIKTQLKLVDILYHASHKGSSKEIANLSLGVN